MLLHVARSTLFVSWRVPATCADTLSRAKRHIYAGTTRPNGTKYADVAWVNPPSAQRYPVSTCVLLMCNEADNSFAEKEHPGSESDEIWPQFSLRYVRNPLIFVTEAESSYRETEQAKHQP
jgi:hypothetical protein